MISVDKQDRVWIVTLDRPNKANSLTKSMLSALCDVMDTALTAKLGALILTGTGKVFSAGADLSEARNGLATDPVWEELSTRIAALPCLTIAALNGTSAGGAFGMILACDLRITVPSANFFYPVMKLGFLPQPSDPMRMTCLMGPARAKMILMAGQKIDADTAAQWGLIDRVVASDTLLQTAMTIGADAIAADNAHVRAIKRMVPSSAAGP